MSRPRHLPAVRSPAEARPPHRRRRSLRQRAILVIGCGTALFLVTGAGLAAYTLVQYSSIDRVGDLALDRVAKGEPRNYLIVGSDDREEAAGAGGGDVEGQRSDTIIVLRLDPRTESAALLSFPRDLWVPIAGHGGRHNRINAAFSESRQVLTETIKENFGIQLHHYVEVDFAGFKRLVEAVGGVPLWFDRAVRDRDSGLYVEELGCVTLTADQALPFVRSRKLDVMTSGGWQRDPTADLGRMTRQQVFIRRAVDRAVDRGLSNPLKLRELVDIGVRNVTLDRGMGVSEILELARQFEDFSSDRLETFSLPVVERGDGATVELDKGEAEPILNIFRGLEPDELSPGLVSVTVLNGTPDGEEGLAGEVTWALALIGFDVQVPGDVESHAQTTIYHRPGEENYAVQVARYIRGGAAVAARDDVESGEVLLVAGGDFTTVHEEPTPLDQVTIREAFGTADPASGGGAEAADASGSAGTTTTTVESAAVSDESSPGGATASRQSPPTTQYGTVVGEPPGNASC
jgi:polyisoprenyl-teichoic acid--peptidoglycan teichoic acid transferase